MQGSLFLLQLYRLGFDKYGPMFKNKLNKPSENPLLTSHLKALEPSSSLNLDIIIKDFFQLSFPDWHDNFLRSLKAYF